MDMYVQTHASIGFHHYVLVYSVLRMQHDFYDLDSCNIVRMFIDRATVSALQLLIHT